MIRGISVLAWIAAVVTAGAQVSQPAPPHRIAGVIVNGLSGRPLAGVRVAITRDGHRDREITTITTSDGRFAFAGVSAGKWRLMAERKDFPRQSYGQKPGFGSPGSSVVTGPDEATEDLVFSLYPPVVVEGRVIDENAEPVENAMVQLLVSTVAGGRKRIVTVRSARTNDLGEYRFWQLPAGTYFVVATGTPWFSDTLRRPDEGSEALPNSYEPTYYPNASDLSSALPIVLRPGDQGAADLTLRRGRGVTVRLNGAQSSDVVILTSEAKQLGGLIHRISYPDSSRVFKGVLPGRYTLILPPQSPRGIARSQTFEVGNADMNLTLSFPEPVKITATARIVDGDPALLARTMFVLEHETETSGQARMASADGKLAFSGLPPGRYRLLVPSPDLYVQAFNVEGARNAQGFVELPGSGAVRMEIVLGGNGGIVKGKVYQGGHPAVGASVLLVPRVATGDRTDYQMFQTDSDGSFEWKAVKPGEHVIFASLEPELEYTNPAAIRRQVELGEVVRVEPKKSYDLRLEPVVVGEH